MTYNGRVNLQLYIRGGKGIRAFTAAYLLSKVCDYRED